LSTSQSGLYIEITIATRRAINYRKPRKVEATAAPRIPRTTRLMALAIKFQDMVDRGEVQDYADLARLGLVTRARLTQIMNLLLLAPDIQEEILLKAMSYTERALRLISTRVSWEEQRRMRPNNSEPLSLIITDQNGVDAEELTRDA
jgi:hypothetical protein